MSKTTPVMIARAATIRISIAAAERYLLTLDDPKDRAAQREHIELLRLALRAAR